MVLICFKNVFDTCFGDLLQKQSTQKNFKIGHILVILGGKLGENTIFYVFFFTPLFFRPESVQSQKKISATKNTQNHYQKNLFGILDKIDH